jgi:hypothetical protein
VRDQFKIGNFELFDSVAQEQHRNEHLGRFESQHEEKTSLFVEAQSEPKLASEQNTTLVKLQLQNASHGSQTQRANPSNIWWTEKVPSGKEVLARWTQKSKAENQAVNCGTRTEQTQ